AEVIGLIEVDAQGRRARTEVFAVDRLGDAVARSYERYADLLPDGPARARAAATARSFSGIAAFEWAAAVAPAIEVVDHRTLGTWSARGAEAFLEHLRALLGLADDAATRDDDVLALQPDALLVRRTHFGTARAGGGAYERLFLLLHVFGADGLVTRLEFFDSDREDEALARFDELTAAPTGARLTGAPLRAAEKRERRVRPNAATANAARLDAAIAVRDADALPTLTADVCEVVDHTTGATYGRQGSLTTWRTLLSARDPTWRQEPLATLGDSLALFRLWMSASGFAGATFDVGAYEREGIALLEVDAQGRRARTEVFAADRLDDAVARLYERYAELLPDGPARARAAAGARAMWGPGFDLDRIAAAIAPAIEVVDHRSLGTWSARGAEAFLEHFRALLEVTDDAATRSEEVLGLHSDAFVVRATHTGTAHAGGGAYERPFVVLNAFGPDGLTRVEFFDAERE